MWIEGDELVLFGRSFDKKGRVGSSGGLVLERGEVGYRRSRSRSGVGV